MSNIAGTTSLVKKGTLATLDPSGSAQNFKESNSGENNEFSNEPNANDVPPTDLIFPVNSIFPKCVYCNKRAVLDEVREVSGTQIFWACMLMCTLPCICWLPFCLGRCDDRRLECTNCREVRDYFQAPMCPCFCWHERLW